MNIGQKSRTSIGVYYFIKMEFTYKQKHPLERASLF